MAEVKQIKPDNVTEYIKKREQADKDANKATQETNKVKPCNVLVDKQ